MQQNWSSGILPSGPLSLSVLCPTYYQLPSHASVGIRSYAAYLEQIRSVRAIAQLPSLLPCSTPYHLLSYVLVGSRSYLAYVGQIRPAGAHPSLGQTKTNVLCTWRLAMASEKYIIAATYCVLLYYHARKMICSWIAL